MHFAFACGCNTFIFVTGRFAALGDNIAKVHVRVAIASTVFEVINVLSTVGVSNVDFVVATPMLVLNHNDFGERGAEDSSEDYKGS